MGLYTKLPDNISEVDVIIAGGTSSKSPCGAFIINQRWQFQTGGTPGCIVAGRLAEADPG